MSYGNGSVPHDQPILQDSGISRIMEESVTAAEWQRFTACYDSEFQTTRETDHCFECRGVRRVVVRRLNGGHGEGLMTFECVPPDKFHGRDRADAMAVGSGSKVRVSGEEFVLDRPIIFRRQKE